MQNKVPQKVNEGGIFLAAAVLYMVWVGVCWNGFISPVLGLRSLNDFQVFALSLLIAGFVVAVWSLKESKPNK